MENRTWGPERPVFTMEVPASYPVFNSIRNNPTIGDERSFLKIGEIKPKTELGNSVMVSAGKQYLVYIYIHNNSSSAFNDSEHKNVGVALRTRVSVIFPHTVSSAETELIKARITADNSDPTSVWASVSLSTMADNLQLRYVDGSAKIYNDWKTNGKVLPKSLFTDGGTLIGLNELNGVMPGCEEYHCVICFVLQAE